jgi:hypothetical protein
VYVHLIISVSEHNVGLTRVILLRCVICFQDLFHLIQNQCGSHQHGRVLALGRTVLFNWKFSTSTSILAQTRELSQNYC